MSQGPDAPPAGYRRVGGLCGAFIEHAGPLYGRLGSAGLNLGFRVQGHHVNPLDCAHGGMLASLADMQLAAGAMYREEGWSRILPTVSLQMDFLAPARRGAWVEGSSTILRATGSLVFAQALITADGEPALRASGILRRGAVTQGEGPWDPLEVAVGLSLPYN